MNLKKQNIKNIRYLIIHCSEMQSDVSMDNLKIKSKVSYYFIEKKYFQNGEDLQNSLHAGNLNGKI